MRYVVGGRGWLVQVGNNRHWFDAGTVIDDTTPKYGYLATHGPPPDALPLDQLTFNYMTSSGGVVGLGYPFWQVDPRAITGGGSGGGGPSSPAVSLQVLIGSTTSGYLQVTMPTNVTKGTPFNVTVTAKDASGNTTVGYGGTVHFSSTDGAATLPTDSTLVAGTKTFSATFNTLGSQTVTVTDTVTGSITGAGSANVVAIGATHFGITAIPSTATAGVAISYTISALDASNNVVAGYTGTVHFTCSDSAAVLPADATLTSGVGTFSATLKTAGNQTITATDTVTSTITATTGTIVVSAAATAHFVVSGPGAAANGFIFAFSVTAVDAFGNTNTGYAGLIHFTATDSYAVLPANTHLTSGAGSFSAILYLNQTTTLTATDTVSPGINGTSGNIVVTTTLTVDPNWYKRWQFAGVNPTVVMDFEHGLYWDGTQTLTVPTGLVAGGPTITAGSGLLCNQLSNVAAGAFLSAFTGTSYGAQVTTWNAAAAAGANVGIAADNNVDMIFGNVSGGGFLTYSSAGGGMSDSHGLDWTKANYGAVSIASAIRRLSSVGSGGSATATGVSLSDTNGYAVPGTVYLGSWNGAFLFGQTSPPKGYISAMAVHKNTTLPNRIIPPPAAFGTNGFWWNGTATAGINYGNILQWEYTQPWMVICAALLFYPAGGGHNGVSGIFFTNVPAAGNFPGYEFWPDGNGNVTVRIINAAGTFWIDLHGSTNIADGKWHIVAATYDGSGLAAGVHLWVDGVPETITVVADTLGGRSIVAAGQSFIIGNQQAQNYAIFGAIGMLRVYTGPKPTSFIQNFVLNYTLPPIDATCALAPAFSEGSTNTTTADLSASGFTGTLTSSNCWLRG